MTDPKNTTPEVSADAQELVVGTPTPADAETPPTTAAETLAAAAPLAASAVQITETALAETNAAPADSKEAAPEYPEFKRAVGSFFTASINQLKEAFGLGENGIIIGIPEDTAAPLGLTHGEKIKITVDGTTEALPDNEAGLTTFSPDNGGPIQRRALLPKALRDLLGVQRESDRTKTLPHEIIFTITLIGENRDQKALWVKKPAQEETPNEATQDATPAKE